MRRPGHIRLPLDVHDPFAADRDRSGDPGWVAEGKVTGSQYCEAIDLSHRLLLRVDEDDAFGDELLQFVLYHVRPIQLLLELVQHVLLAK